MTIDLVDLVEIVAAGVIVEAPVYSPLSWSALKQAHRRWDDEPIPLPLHPRWQPFRFEENGFTKRRTR